MTIYFGLERHSKSKFKDWSRWGPARLSDLLETLRTGEPRPDNMDVLDTRLVYKGFTCLEPSNGLHEMLIEVANAHGLTRAEFLFYLTVQHQDDPVYYPFTWLSRPDAQTLGWSWNDCLRWARFKLGRMATHCNSATEAAGIGNNEITPTQFLCWSAAHFSRQICTIKSRMPNASQEVILTQILDRWGLPMIPWTHHQFSASLCKLQDHGIAIKFGFTNGDRVFDHRTDIDLNQYTVTLDSWMTNVGMFNHAPKHWPKQREILRCVSLHHSWWRPHPSLGSRTWCRSADFDNQLQPCRPEPEFDVPLVPVEYCVRTDDDAMDIAYVCHLCET